MRIVIEGSELTLANFDNTLGIFKEKKIVVFYCRHNLKSKYVYIYISINVAIIASKASLLRASMVTLSLSIYIYCIYIIYRISLNKRPGVYFLQAPP